MKRIATFIIVLFAFFSMAQNPSFHVMDSLTKLAESDYALAKKRLIEYEKLQPKIDPSDKFFFLINSLREKDTIYFKSEIQKLIQFNGYRYYREDSSVIGQSELFNRLLKEVGLDIWLIITSDKYYPEWVKINPEAFEIRKKIDEMAIMDQFVIEMTLGFNDTISPLGKDLHDLYNKSQYSNVLKVINLANKDKILPNNFDHGLSTGNIWQTFLWHSMSDKKNYQIIWQQILPYIEATYFVGKVDISIFGMYDKIMYFHEGKQYYGFLENVPIMDFENFKDRQLKYQF